MKLLGTVLMACWFALPFSPVLSEGGAQQDVPEPGMNVGHQYFVQYCGSCHGVDGCGNGPAAPALRHPPPDLTRIAQRHGGQFPATVIAAQIDGRTVVLAHGSRDMPVWGRRFRDQFGGDSLGEEFVRGHLLIFTDYLQAIQK